MKMLRKIVGSSLQLDGANKGKRTLWTELFLAETSENLLDCRAIHIGGLVVKDPCSSIVNENKGVTDAFNVSARRR